MASTLYAAVLKDELDPSGELAPLTHGILSMAWDEANENKTNKYGMVTACAPVVGGIMYTIRGFLGRRGHLEINWNEPLRFFWTTAGNGTPVFEITSDMEDQRVKDLFGLLFDLVYG